MTVLAAFGTIKTEGSKAPNPKYMTVLEALGTINVPRAFKPQTLNRCQGPSNPKP